MNEPNDKPLPQPPTRPFGRKRSFGEPEPQEQLTADRMAQAAAEGKLDEFLQQEMPDNDYARNLAAMVLGMTGMLPAAGAMPPSPEQPKTEEAQTTGAEPSVDVPDDVRQAIMSGDVQGLMEKLRREHAKRNPGSASEAAAQSPEPAAPQGIPVIDKKLIDSLVRIAQENSVSLDWIILRAIKVFVQEYEKSGKL
jgi:hypothetical protein